MKTPAIALALCLVTSAGAARAQSGAVRVADGASVDLGGYLEAYYGWNFNQPSNGVTNARGFDDRHGSLTLSNAVLDASFRAGPVSGRLALQLGPVGQVSYLSEPVAPGTGSVGANDGSLWRSLQQAYVGWRAPVGRGLQVDGGIFLSPVGCEGLAVKDQWNWSRSNLFFALPFYHAGLRASYPVTERVTVSAAAYNGWNDVVDNNDDKSVMASVTWTLPDRATVSALYLGGVERPRGASSQLPAEGAAWRHLIDVWAQVQLTPRLAVMAHVDGGVEPNALGVAGWIAGALYVRWQPWRRLYLAARGDYFHEVIPDAAQATPVFWSGARHVGEVTLTADLRPHDNLSVRLEFRRDIADRALYFHGLVDALPDGSFAPNARSQDTLTLGATAWF
ncbi:MAG: porin [Polyangiales bacterium]